VSVLALALLGAACSGDARGPGAKPADLALNDVGNGCVGLTEGATAVGSWCGTNITSFDVERAHVDPNGRFVVLLVVNGQLEPSKDYAAWDTAGDFVLVGTSHTDGLIFSVESEGQRLRCGGAEQLLECTPESN
jgi:hypothetical protein